jgi:hypothetical protein
VCFRTKGVLLHVGPERMRDEPRALKEDSGRDAVVDAQRNCEGTLPGHELCGEDWNKVITQV